MAKVVIHNSAFPALRSDPAIMKVLEDKAEAIAAAAGEGFTTDSHPGGNRGRVTVFADSFEGILAEARHGALSQAVGSG